MCPPTGVQSKRHNPKIVKYVHYCKTVVHKTTKKTHTKNMKRNVRWTTVGRQKRDLNLCFVCLKKAGIHTLVTLTHKCYFVCKFNIHQRVARATDYPTAGDICDTDRTDLRQAGNESGTEQTAEQIIHFHVYRE